MWGRITIDKAAITLANNPGAETIKLLEDRVREAELHLMRQMSQELLGGESYALTPERERAWERKERIRKLLSPYFWIRSRVIGVFNVLIHGECKLCDLDD